MKKLLLLSSLALASLAGAAILNDISFTNAFMNGGTAVTFRRPVFFAEIPGKDSNYVVLEQQVGNAIVVHRTNGSWVKDTLFHVDVVNNRNEMGLLGLAFHPNFASNHKYYVFYSQSFTAPYATGATDDCAPTNPGCGVNVIEERVTDGSYIKDSGTKPKLILSLRKSAMNHNGSDLHFGPKDGYLYVGIGDGGDPQGDPDGRGQNPDTLLGKFLRIDVNGADAYPSDTTRNYAIPTDNPFYNTPGTRREIWNIGVRNPWRWSFDRLTGTPWVGEVGNATREEVDTLAKGANLGWRLMEGHACQPNVICTLTGYTLPIWDYGHSGTGDTVGASVVGGYVFRGNPASPYYGLYFFGDNSKGNVFVMRSANGVKTDIITLHPTPTSTGVAVTGLSAFGEDSQGSLYALGWTSNTNGSVFLLSSTNLKPSALSPFHSNPHNISWAKELRLHPQDYEIRGLDGRRIHGNFKGMALVRKKGSSEPAQLLAPNW